MTPVAVGDTIALSIVPDGPLITVQSDPPLFGRVVVLEEPPNGSLGHGIQVLWETGWFQEFVDFPGEPIDIIVAAAASDVQRWLRRTVDPAPPIPNPGTRMRGQVVGVYTRIERQDVANTFLLVRIPGGALEGAPPAADRYYETEPQFVVDVTDST